MAKVAWREEFTVGNPAIDAQHREILGILNEFFEHPGRPSYASLYARFISAVDRHFAFEESLMAKHGYPRAEAHRREHARIRDALVAFAGTKASNEDLGRARGYLFRWISEHVLSEEMDRDFAIYLRKRGVYVVAPHG